MKTLFLIIAFSQILVLPMAHASAVLLTDAKAMECRVFEDPAFWRCDLWYEKARIFAGRDVGPESANGDCVICRNVRAHALKNGFNVIVNRDVNWDHPDFLQYTTDETLTSKWP